MTAAPGQVQSLARALGVLRVIARAEDGLILRDVARGAGLPVSTAHRLLTTLEAERFVRSNPETGVWTIGPDAFLAGAAFLRTRDLPTLARPRLRSLAARWGETASLYVEAEGRLVCLAQAESRAMVRAVVGVGGAVEPHCSGAGKAWLAAAEPETRAAALAAPLPRRTARTITAPDALARALAEAAAQGFAIDDEEHVEGVRCAAAAVLDHDGRPVAALSVSGPAARLDRESLARVGAAVAAAAADLSREMGWAPHARVAALDARAGPGGR
jgi:IclR family acetate operon transcriptional repressor